MFGLIKKNLYFLVAYYFRIFAKIQLAIWNPKIIVVTGSSGKTTLLHLIESELGKQARYSHHANSTYGIPFDILGLKRKRLMISEWFFLFLAAPFLAFKKPYKERIYIVEVDCDRPGEGSFLGSLLKPEVTIWLNTGKTHSANFDSLILEKKFSSTEEAIAYEFAYLIEHTTALAIVNGDLRLETDQLSRCAAKIVKVKSEQLQNYRIIEGGSVFKIDGNDYQINQLLPKDFFYSIIMAKNLVDYLGLKFNPFFPLFSLPPGRSTIFSGIKNTILIDSSYNATPDGMKATIEMFDLYPAKSKWLVIGDMIELGQDEKKEHEKLADLISLNKYSKIILVGPRVSKYTFQKLQSEDSDPNKLVKFDLPKPALDYLTTNLCGGEVVLFKGARFLEGVIEHLLLDKNDINKLCRREEIWQIRRKKWGL